MGIAVPWRCFLEHHLRTNIRIDAGRINLDELRLTIFTDHDGVLADVVLLLFLLFDVSLAARGSEVLHALIHP